MHSILLVISKLEKGKAGLEPAWQTTAATLEQRARQAECVQTLFENCWLIAADRDGLSFFNHAIAIADNAKLRCRICVLRKPQNAAGIEPAQGRLKGVCHAVARVFLGMIRLFPPLPQQLL